LNGLNNSSDPDNDKKIKGIDTIIYYPELNKTEIVD